MFTCESVLCNISIGVGSTLLEVVFPVIHCFRSFLTSDNKTEHDIVSIKFQDGNVKIII